MCLSGSELDYTEDTDPSFIEALALCPNLQSLDCLYGDFPRFNHSQAPALGKVLASAGDSLEEI